jgi:UDP-N-acetylglucosamine:LPS N-acetylglucosamine transferase
MSFLENLENAMFADESGRVPKKVTDAIKEMLEDPEHHKIMERLKYMEDNGI